MKKIFLAILSALLVISVVCPSVQAADTSTSTTQKTSFEKMGPPPPGGPNGAPDGKPGNPPPGKPGQRPNKKPDSKPGGDRVPPEFSSTSSSSSTTNNK